MTYRMKIIMTVLFLLSLNQLHAQHLTLAGENYLLLNGERFKNEKIILKQADGDWFSTANDGHGTLEFLTVYDGRRFQFDLEWDGKDPHVINNETRHQGRTGEFLLTLPDK